MKDFRIRCSSLGRLMTEPKTKSEGPLSVGAKTHIRELAAQDIFGVDFEVSDRKMEKGKLVEPESIGLLNGVRGLSLVKNTERRTNEWITGEADLFDTQAKRGHDVKSAWSLQSFPICPEDVADAQRKTYEWQMVGYCWLWEAEEWSIDYCMVNTPDALIGFEPLSLHVVNHIPAHLRLTSWIVKRDREKERAIAARVEAAREYYTQVIAEFDRTHAGKEPPPWVASDIPAAVAPVAAPTNSTAPDALPVELF